MFFFLGLGLNTENWGQKTSIKGDLPTHPPPKL